MRLRAAAAALLLVAAACAAGAGEPSVLRVSGSTTVSPVATDAAEVLRRERGLRATVDSQGGSAGGLAQLAQGQVDVAMTSKPVSAAERARHPSVHFVETAIGEDAVAIVVRREIHAGGVRTLSRAQLRALFEGRVGRWSELGGPEVPVFVYDKEPGRGTREVLDAYLYGPGVPAPPPPAGGRYAVVGGNEEARAKAASTPGSIVPLSAAFLAGRSDLVPVAVDGVAPTPRHVADGTYPLARRLFLVTDGPPRGAARTFVEYVLSDAGQALVRRHGYLRLSDVAP